MYINCKDRCSRAGWRLVGAGDWEGEHYKHVFILAEGIYFGRGKCI